MMIKTKFTANDAERAHAEWGMNCGPGALAAIMGLTLDEVRPHMTGFEEKRYTNPSMMIAVLGRIGRPFRKIGANWPDYGLVRIQWEGPWTKPGVPMAARYRWTHWIGACRGQRADNYGIFDINAIGNGTGWCSSSDWSEQIAPWIIKEYVPRGDGGWHVTHGLEVDQPKGGPNDSGEV
jgi:hypothetical protein